MSAEGVLRVAELVKLVVQQEKDVERLEDELVAAKANLLRTTTEDLPELMKELTLSVVRLDDGTQVAVNPDVQCAITEANRPAAHSWLRQRGFGSLIKSRVSVSFGVGEEDLQQSTIEVLNEHLENTDHAPISDELVHPATLKSFVKERLAAAADEPQNVPPADLFSLRPFDRAKVVPPKAPKPPKFKG